ncbi:MAG: hypothetical protein HYZ34_00765, partial [Ignavibacteriae bacterium]|nr:hypothetical protein [Ignavibacteriota bacterium]
MKILVIIACMFLVTVFVQSGDLKFDRLSINDGLSENVVYCILQDRKGFMWFGTHDGLNRYDGYTFKVFRSDPFDSTSLCNNMVTALHEDKSGRLWVGTYNGLSLFDAKTETFRSFYHDSTRASSLSFNQVNAMCEDKNGRLLFATSIGVNEMISEGQFRRYGSSNYLNDDVQSLFADSAGTVWVGTSQVVDTVDFNNHCLQTIFPVIHQALAITSDRRGRLLIGTFDKLILYGTNDKTMKSFTPDMHEKKTHSNNTVKYFLRDSDGSVWLGTYNGLMKFDANTLTAQRFFHEPADVQSLGSNKIYSLYEDHSGVLWVGTFGGGVSKTYLRQKKFTHYRIEPTDSTKIGLNMMMSVFEDRTGLLWLGTWDKGVVCFNRERESYQLFPSSLGVKRPSFEDSMGNIYSAENFHIVKYNRGTGIISSTELSFGTILCLLPDSDGSFWAGTSVGLVHFNLALDVIEVFKHNAKDTTSIGSGVVGSIAGDANGILWIGAGGLNRFDKKTGHFRNFKPDPGNKFRLCLDENIPIHVARDGRIWIGSRGNGLFCFTPATETFVRFTETDGLPNNYIYGILEDENRSLWISTNRGLCRFEPNAKTWKKYDV